MSWAMKRRMLYLFGVFVFLSAVISIPAAMILSTPPTCFDGVQNQGEHAIDRGGPCLLLDNGSIIPHAVLWSRAFSVRDGLYDAVAYIENPNAGAGVYDVRYRMGLYDDENVLVAERTGKTFVMPGGITPVFEGGIDTGKRDVGHTIFQIDDIRDWTRMKNVAADITVIRSPLEDVQTMPRLRAVVRNNSVADIRNLTFVAVIFNPAGNAFASSQTAMDRLNAGQEETIIFTWPKGFIETVGRIDVIPVHKPVIDPIQEE